MTVITRVFFVVSDEKLIDIFGFDFSNVRYNVIKSQFGGLYQLSIDFRYETERCNWMLNCACGKCKKKSYFSDE